MHGLLEIIYAENVIKAGVKGKLKSLVKWEVGVDNVDFDSCKNIIF